MQDHHGRAHKLDVGVDIAAATATAAWMTCDRPMSASLTVAQTTQDYGTLCARSQGRRATWHIQMIGQYAPRHPQVPPGSRKHACGLYASPPAPSRPSLSLARTGRGRPA
jgi:hypothetical protein